MKHPARWLIALALLACALAWWWNAPPSEPVYHGKPLSQWMRNSQEEIHLAATYEEIRTIGPPVVAWLAYTAEHGHSRNAKPGVFRALLAQMGWKNPASNVPAHYDERIVAIEMLGEMGVMAKPAMPALVRILNSSSYDHVQAAASTLNLMGSNSWPVVVDQLAHGSNLARCELLNTMWLRLDQSRGPVLANDVQRVYMLLTCALQDPEPNIRRNAATSVGVSVSFAERDWGSLIDQSAAILWFLPDQQNKEVRDACSKLIMYYYVYKFRLTPLLSDPDERKRRFARDVLDLFGKTSPNAEAP